MISAFFEKIKKYRDKNTGFLGKKRHNAGFTLAEVLIVVAIMSILAGFGFIAISQNNKRLTLLEMDDTAKKIFLAAQNHLTVSETNGTWKQLVAESKVSGGANGAVAPSLGGDFEIDNKIYKVIYGKGEAGNSAGNEIGGQNDVSKALNLILPTDAVNIVGDSSYAIIYDPDTASIYGVYYSASSTFGNGQDHLDFATEIKDVDRFDNKKRLEHGNPLIGYYGNATGTEKEEGTNLSALQKIKVWFTNDENALTLHISDPNHLSLSTLEVQFIGASSNEDPEYVTEDNEKIDGRKVFGRDRDPLTYVHFDGSDETTIILDSLNGPHFKDLLPEFYPGENITAQVTLEKTDPVSGRQVVTGSATDNSLYEQIYSTSSTDQYVARISNIRHLENLSKDISGISTYPVSGTQDKPKKAFSVTKAVQTKDIALFNKTFTGIVPDDALLQYDGNHKVISDLNISTKTEHSKGYGLFSSISANGEREFNITNATLVNPHITSDENLPAGAFIGAFKGSSLSFSDVHITMKNEPTEPTSIPAEMIIKNGGDTGGFAGRIESSDKVSFIDTDLHPVEIAGKVSLKSTSGSIGGVVGSLKAKSLWLENVSVTPDTDVKVGSSTVNTKDVANTGYVFIGSKGNSGHVGGIIGSLQLNGTGSDKSSIISTNFLSGHIGYVAAANDGSAGGLIGKLEGGETLSIADSYASSYVQSAGNQGAGGFIGSISGGIKKISTSYVGGRTINGIYITDFLNLNTDENEEYLKNYEGRYNVTAFNGGSAGGFIGRIENGTVTINTAYSTASVYSNGNNAAGGMIGSNAGTAILGNTYASGFVQNDDNNKAKAGMYIGIKGTCQLLNAKKNYAVQGIYGVQRNDANATTENVTNTGAELAVVESVTIATENTPYHSNNTTTKNADTYDKTLSTPTAIYPFMPIHELAKFTNSTSTYDVISSHTGDWEMPKEVKIEDEKIVNSNQLYVEFTFDYKPGTTYKWNLYLHGEQSESDRYIQMRFDTAKGTDKSISNQRVLDADSWSKLYSKTNDPYNEYREYDVDNHYLSFVNADGKITSRFYIDDVSHYKANFYSFFDDFYPGEYLQVRAVKDDSDPTNVTKDTPDAIYGEVNSLYDNDPAINYDDPHHTHSQDSLQVAYISNTRHLLNLDENIYRAFRTDGDSYKYKDSWPCKNAWPKITSAVQIADIAWTSLDDVDGLTEATDARRKALPYLDELNKPISLQSLLNGGYDPAEVKVYAGNSQVSVKGNVMPGISLRESLDSYDGNGHYLENYAISFNEQAGQKTNNNYGGGCGLFTNVYKKFTISNLNMKDICLGKGNSSGAGVLIGKVYSETKNGNIITLSNDHILGRISSENDNDTGTLIGLNDQGDVRITKCTSFPDVFNIPQNSATNAGGLVGNSQNGKLFISDCIFGTSNSTFDFHPKENFGGLVGHQGEGSLTVQNSSVAGSIIHADSGQNAGGVIGLTENGTVTISDFILGNNNSDIAISSPIHTGGFVGSYSGSNLSITNGYLYGSNVNITGGQNAGGIAGSFVDGYLYIKNTHVKPAAITVQSKGSYAIGGFVGIVSGGTGTSEIENSDFGPTGAASLETNVPNTGMGGYVGFIKNSNFKFTNCDISGHNIILVNSKTQGQIGGYVGKDDFDADKTTKSLSFNNCYISGSNITLRQSAEQYGRDQNVGGFVGYMRGKLEFNTTGNASTTISGHNIIIETSAKQSSAGGIVGYHAGSENRLTMNAVHIDPSQWDMDNHASNFENQKNNGLRVISRDTSDNSAAGGIIGREEGNAKLQFVKIDSNDLFVLSGRDAGGFIGYANGELDIDDSYVHSNQGNILVQRPYMEKSKEKGTAGGLIGTSDAILDVDYTKVYGQQLLVMASSRQKDMVATPGKDKKGNDVQVMTFQDESVGTSAYAIGGFIGNLTGHPNQRNDIENCLSSAYLYGKYATYTGGFIGHINLSYDTDIKNCYAGGRTRGQQYRSQNDEPGFNYTNSTRVSFNNRNYNVIGEQYTGGFVGYIENGSINLRLEQDFSSCSVTSSNTDFLTEAGTGAVGGFLGYANSGARIKFDNCYSIGLVRPTKNKDTINKSFPVGAFIGKLDGSSVDCKSSGFIRFSTSNTKNDFLKTRKDPNVPQSGNVPGIGIYNSKDKGNTYEIDTSNLNPSETVTTYPYDNSDPSLTGYTYPYPIWTKSSSATNAEVPYYGDWDQDYLEDLKAYYDAQKSGNKTSNEKEANNSFHNWDDAESSTTIDSATETTSEYLTPAGISTETKPDIVTKKQTVRKKAS